MKLLQLFLIILIIVPVESGKKVHEWRPYVSECTPFTFDCEKCKQTCTFWIMDGNFTQSTLCWPGYMNVPMRQFAIAKFKGNDTCPGLPDPPTTSNPPESTTKTPSKDDNLLPIIGIITAFAILIILCIALCCWKRRRQTYSIQFRSDA